MMCEGVALEHIVREVGSPAYIYSAATIRDRYERLDRTLAPVSHRIDPQTRGKGPSGFLIVRSVVVRGKRLGIPSGRMARSRGPIPDDK